MWLVAGNDRQRPRWLAVSACTSWWASAVRGECPAGFLPAAGRCRIQGGRPLRLPQATWSAAELRLPATTPWPSDRNRPARKAYLAWACYGLVSDCEPSWRATVTHEAVASPREI